MSISLTHTTISMSASMSVATTNTKLVTFETSLPYAQVVARLDEAVNKQGSGEIIKKMRDATTREDIETVINTITGVENDFL